MRAARHTHDVILDAETTRLIRPEDDHDFSGPLSLDFAPLKFSCVATLAVNLENEERESRVWVETPGAAEEASHDYSFYVPGDASDIVMGAVAETALPALGETACVHLVRYLSDLVLEHRARLITFNGVSFDLRVLANQLPPGADTEREACRRMALCSKDPCLQMWCERGFPVGLNAMLLGWNLPVKLEHGKDAPDLWNNGNCIERARVLRYCADDVRATHEVVSCIDRHGEVRWVSSRSGRMCAHRLRGGRLCDAAELALVPYPSMQWASEPEGSEDPRGGLPHRDRAMGWLFVD